MKSFLDTIADKGLSAEDLKGIQASLITRNCVKGQILLRKGDTNDNSYFVKSGCLRSYSIDEKGKEHIFMFAPEGWMIGDIASHVKHEPAVLFIDAIENSVVEIISNNIFPIPAMPTAAAVNQLSRRVAVLQKRIIMLMSASLQERYLDFIETYPEIVQRVPQKMIASYLGVTPEALSKIRGDMTKSR